MSEEKEREKRACGLYRENKERKSGSWLKLYQSPHKQEKKKMNGKEVGVKSTLKWNEWMKV